MSRSRISALLAVPLAALAFGACGESPEDQARDSGKDIGKAVAQFQTADNAEQAGQAIDSFRSAVDGMKSETKDRVKEQVDTQGNTLQQAVKEAQSADNPQDALTDLQKAAQDLRSQAQSFQSSNNSVAVAFWEGVEEGYDDEID